MTRPKSAVAALLAAALLSGCSSSPEPAPQAAPGSRGTDAGETAASKEPSPSGRKTEKDGRSRSGGGPGGGKETSAPGDSQAGGGGPAPGGSGAPALAEASSVVVDAPDDAAGDPAPAYAELVGASITGRGDVAEIVLEVKGEIPDEVDGTHNLLAGIGIEYEGEMGGISIAVQGTRDGWKAFYKRGEEQRELEDGWRIDGSRFVWTLPWEDLGGPRRFRWGASLRWFEFVTGDPMDAEQSADRAPESEPAVFPSEG